MMPSAAVQRRTSRAQEKRQKPPVIVCGGMMESKINNWHNDD
jgi:hypothetical protein